MCYCRWLFARGSVSNRVRNEVHAAKHRRGLSQAGRQTVVCCTAGRRPLVNCIVITSIGVWILVLVCAGCVRWTWQCVRIEGNVVSDEGGAV